MAAPSFSTPQLDPNCVIQGLSRALTGVLRTGTVTTNTPYGEYARWLYVGGSGNITYVKWDGTTQLISNVAAGVWHPICSIQVNTTGTSATGLVWGS